MEQNEPSSDGATLDTIQLGGEMDYVGQRHIQDRFGGGRRDSERSEGEKELGFSFDRHRVRNGSLGTPCLLASTPSAKHEGGSAGVPRMVA